MPSTTRITCIQFRAQLIDSTPTYQDQGTKPTYILKHYLIFCKSLYELFSETFNFLSIEILNFK